MQIQSIHPSQASIDSSMHHLGAFAQVDSNKPSFADLALAKPILQALEKSGYTHPTPIQQGAIPAAMAGRDLLLSAQTGSGKTAAFVLPILDRIIKNNHNPQAVRALILTPTRELALQVQDNVRIYSSKARGIFSIPLVGGAPYGGQIRALRKGVQIIVATPGRLIDHLNEGRIDLSSLDVLVLDEADRMLDMGFSDAIETILAATPSTRQTVMSSATWDGAVGKIAESFTQNPERIAIKVESAHIDESVYFCDDFRHKNDILHEVLNNPEINQAVIFAATKMSAEKLAGELNDKGYKARYLHGDLPQAKRNRIVGDVKAGKCQFLVATDVAARGIDIATISHVINYDLPRQAEDYVHRIGRCGRAGRTGMAINLCSVDDCGQFFAINRYLGRQMKTATIVGLEPKRNFGKDERRSLKRGNKRRNSQGDLNHGQCERSFGQDNKRRPKSDRHAYRQASAMIADNVGNQRNLARAKNRAEAHAESRLEFEPIPHRTAERPTTQKRTSKAGYGKTQPAFAKRSHVHQDKAGKTHKAHKADRGERLLGAASKKRQKDRPKSAVHEIVFNQTTKKHRFGDN